MIIAEDLGKGVAGRESQTRRRGSCWKLNYHGKNDADRRYIHSLVRYWVLNHGPTIDTATANCSYFTYTDEDIQQLLDEALDGLQEEG